MTWCIWCWVQKLCVVMVCAMSEFLSQPKQGWVEVVVGGMFSGKTEELIRRLRRAQFAKQKVQVFKPAIDNRYHDEDVCSHNMTTIRSQPVRSSAEMMQLIHPETKVVGIDEGQFFDSAVVQAVQDLAERGIRVIVAGLDTDWKAQPFEPMPTLMAIAETVTKHHAVCVVCGGTASRTQRTGGGSDKVQVGTHSEYEARCRQHFKPEVDLPTDQSKSATTQLSII